jgi:hypothetical protein
MTKPMTLNLFGFIFFGGFLVIALLIVGAWYCLRQIIKW